MLCALPLMMVLTAGLSTPARAEPRILMVEQPGCIYCARWNADIAPVYPKRPEGMIAPLQRAELRGRYPYGFDLGPQPVVTPTPGAGQAQGGADRGLSPGGAFFSGLPTQMVAGTGELNVEKTK